MFPPLRAGAGMLATATRGASSEAAPGPGDELVARAREGVAIDLAANARHVAVGLILPEGPAAARISDRRRMLHAAHPHRIIGEFIRVHHMLVEVDSDIDDRPLAVVALHFGEHDAHVAQHFLAIERPLAGL